MPIDRRPDIDMREELRRAFFDEARGYIPGCGGALDALMELLDDPTAYHTPGQLAKLGAAFSAAGKNLTAAAKVQAEDRGLSEDDGVVFTYRAPTQQTRVNTKYLRERFPAVNYPEMWQRVELVGTTAIDLPFKS